MDRSGARIKFCRSLGRVLRPWLNWALLWNKQNILQSIRGCSVYSPLEEGTESKQELGRVFASPFSRLTGCSLPVSSGRTPLWIIYQHWIFLFRVSSLADKKDDSGLWQFIQWVYSPLKRVFLQAALPFTHPGKTELECWRLALKGHHFTCSSFPWHRRWLQDLLCALSRYPTLHHKTSGWDEILPKAPFNTIL